MDKNGKVTAVGVVDPTGDNFAIITATTSNGKTAKVTVNVVTSDYRAKNSIPPGGVEKDGCTWTYMGRKKGVLTWGSKTCKEGRNGKTYQTQNGQQGIASNKVAYWSCKCPQSPTSISLASSKITLKKGKSKLVKISYNPKGVVNKSAICGSSSSKIATATFITGASGNKYCKIVAVSKGTATITATSGNLKKATVTVEVDPEVKISKSSTSSSKSSSSTSSSSSSSSTTVPTTKSFTKTYPTKGNCKWERVGYTKYKDSSKKTFNTTNNGSQIVYSNNVYQCKCSTSSSKSSSSSSSKSSSSSSSSKSSSSKSSSSSSKSSSKNSPPSWAAKAKCSTTSPRTCANASYCSWVMGKCYVIGCSGGKTRYTDGKCY